MPVITDRSSEQKTSRVPNTQDGDNVGCGYQAGSLHHSRMVRTDIKEKEKKAQKKQLPHVFFMEVDTPSK